MFNPEGVKGKTAQPPHKILNFMKYGIYDVTLSVKDADTRIELYEFTEYGIKARCESIAIRKAMSAAVVHNHRVWRGGLFDKLCLSSEVGLTAKQLNFLIDRRYIKEPNDKVIDPKELKLTSWVD